MAISVSTIALILHDNAKRLGRVGYVALVRLPGVDPQAHGSVPTCACAGAANKAASPDLFFKSENYFLSLEVNFFY